MNEKELEFILKKGEGQLVEFKETINKNLAKEIVAFANSSGGKIYLGVDDKGFIKGIKITNQLKSQIQDYYHLSLRLYFLEEQFLYLYTLFQ
jgi:ATP-dependent DNA helicase RecG